VQDLLISYIQNHGIKSNSTLLFLHGWRSNKELWKPVLEILTQQGFSWIALDLPGFGMSQTPQLAWDLQDYAHVVENFCQKLEQENIVLIGHSFGGRIAIKLAGRHTRLYIDKLVLIGSHGFVDNSLKNKVLKRAAKLVRPFFKFEMMQPIRRKIYRFMGSEDYVATPEVTQTFLHIINEDLTQRLKNIQQNTLLIWGEEDMDTPLSFGKRMSQLISDSKLKVFPKAGHYVFLEKPQEVALEITKFLD
jgi:pimeloyl-ACP methyl ester carboxylesterase